VSEVAPDAAQAAGPAGSDVLVVVPTYNEADTITNLVAGVAGTLAGASVLVVDDGSPDRTADRVVELATSYPRTLLMRRPAKAGLGSAYRDGLGWGLGHGFGRLVQMDADGSHRAADLPRLLDALEDADVAIGSRYTAGGRVSGWSRRREVLSRVANSYARTVLGLSPHDVTAGFRAYRAGALRALGVEQLGSRGYCCQIELTRRAAAAGLRIREVPIEFLERTDGVSKMSRDVVMEAVARTTLWGVQDRVLHHRLRVAPS
jgi:dolichol-phosphate mannosyltransferase